MEEDQSVVTCRFGVRTHRDGRSDSYFEVFDRTTGAAVAGGMARAEAETEARRRNHDSIGRPAVSVEPAELARLRVAIEVYLAQAGRDARVIIAGAAQALDELREALAHADRLVAEAQGRIGEIYDLSPRPPESWPFSSLRRRRVRRAVEPGGEATP
jgi:hypothetical protein